MNIVIGSGPAGVFCALALLRRGAPVTMVDAGLTLEEHFKTAVKELQSIPPAQWSEHRLAKVRSATRATSSGVPEKYVLGSDYPFRWVDQRAQLEQRGVETLVSFARGGLSNVWGANMLPFEERDLTDWPIRLRDLEPHYRTVAKEVPIVGMRDRLEQLFPFYGEHIELPASEQAQHLLHALGRQKPWSGDARLHFGRARVAIHSKQPGCVRCGLCLYGCPYDLIYSARHTLKALTAFPTFRYLPGVVVQRLQRGASGWKVEGHGFDGELVCLEGARVFLGCGVVNSARIVLETLEAPNREIIVRDSQYFITPMFLFKGPRNVLSEDLYTLAQVALQLHLPSASRYPLHLLVYTYNDLYRQALSSLPWPISIMTKACSTQLLNRLVILQGYLHSHESPSYALRLEGPPAQRRVILSARGNPRTKPLIRSGLWSLFRNSASLGAVPVVPMTKMGAVGKSYHGGASFPMREKPGPGESSVLGELAELPGVHVVDASCFPSVPATNLTYTVMANAYRIGSEVAL